MRWFDHDGSGLQPNDGGPPDAVECATPNPTREWESGTYCVHHVGYICRDIVWYHICVDGQWECPEPGMILVRDCRGFINMHPDLGDAGIGHFDASDDASSDEAGEPDSTEDAAPFDASAGDSSEDDAEGNDSGATDSAPED